MAQTTSTPRDDLIRKYPVFLRPGVLMVILTIEISVQLWKSVFRHGLPLTDKIATRTALTNYWLHAHPPRIRKSHMKFSYTFCLGGISFFLFILLTITGLFLMFYYIPSVDQAYQNIKDLEFVATFGDIIRNMH